MPKKPANNLTLTQNPHETLAHHVPWFTFGRRETFEELTQKWREQKSRLPYLTSAPRFRFFVSVSTPADFSQGVRLAEEFQGQSYSHWEVWFLVAKKARDLSHRINPLQDKRFRLVPEDDENGLKHAWHGVDYVGRLNLGTTFSPVGLFFLAETAGESPSAPLLYWNAVSVSADGKELRQRVKRPQFSPYALEHGNYLGDDWVVSSGQLDRSSSKTLFWKSTPFLQSFAKECREWKLLPAVLSYHRQPLLAPEGPTAEKAPAAESDSPLTVIVCFKDKAEWTARAVMDFERGAGYLDVNFLLIDNGSQKKERDHLERALGFLSKKIRTVEFAKPFNFAAMHNWAIREHVKTENIFLLNNDVFWGAGSVKEILAALEGDDVATVGIPLRYPSGKYQHLGFKASLDNPPHQIRVAPIQQPSPLASWSREVFANTFAACFIKRSLFLKWGGLSEIDLANGFGDVAFCLEAGRQGYRNLFYATAWATHLESGSRGRKYEYWEEASLLRKFPEALRKMEAEDFCLEDFSGMDWWAPLMGSVKESMRRRGGQWDALRETLKSLVGRRSPEKLTP